VFDRRTRWNKPPVAREVSMWNKRQKLAVGLPGRVPGRRSGGLPRSRRSSTRQGLPYASRMPV